MISQWWGYPAAGQHGRWTAVLEPMRSRAMRFHLIKRSHEGQGIVASRRDADGTPRCEVIKDLAVSLTFTE